MSVLQCEIVTPERSLYSEDASFVVLPATAGEMGVYEKHAPTVSTLGMGCVRVTGVDTEEVTRIAVSGGYAQVDGEKVIVLANKAQLLSEVDVEETQAQADELEKQISDLPDDDVTLGYKKSELEWCQLLLHLLGGDASK